MRRASDVRSRERTIPGRRNRKWQISNMIKNLMSLNLCELTEDQFGWSIKGGEGWRAQQRKDHVGCK